jgi:hypothetical protein
MGRRKKTRAIVVIGRRWWSPTSGNTEMTANIYVNGHLVARLEDCGGYGDYYQQAAAEWLEANGYLPKLSGKHHPLWHYRDDFGIELIQECSDVALRRDL